MLPLVAGGIVALLLVCSLAVDASYWRYQQRTEQAAADSAAVAGAISLNFTQPGNAARATTDAQSAAAANGFADGSGSVHVFVDTSPPPAPNGMTYAPGTAVAAVVQQDHPQFFSWIAAATFGHGSARAVAASTEDTGTCLYQLITNSGLLTVNGKFPLNLIHCAGIANGVVKLGPNGCSTTVPGLDYWGANNPNGVPADCGNSDPLIAPANDPCPLIPSCVNLAAITPPASYTAGNYGGATGLPYPAVIQIPPIPGYVVLNNCCPSALTINGPGIAYMYSTPTNKGQGDITGAISGNLVTVYNVNANWKAAGLGSTAPSPQPTQVPNCLPSPQGTTTNGWTAPQSGLTAGVAYYQPPSNSGSVTLDGGGYGSSYFTGLFYAPAGRGTINGGSAIYAMLIIGDVTENGGGSPSQGNMGLTVAPCLAPSLPGTAQGFARKVVLTE